MADLIRVHFAAPAPTLDQRIPLASVDAVDGRVIQHLTEDNPEQWRPAPGGED